MTDTIAGTGFRLAGLAHEGFEPLFAMQDDELRARGISRLTATADFGFPCRVSLEDARTGDELLLLSHEHQPARSPYRASGPIYVRRGAERNVLPVGEVPPYVTRRLISVRAYDARDMMIDATVIDGADVSADLDARFADARVAYVDLHNAKRGCFSCRATRT
jgi:hypothetical protein